ncbi:MAG: M28 family peptidase [Bacteroidota bacterium]
MKIRLFFVLMLIVSFNLNAQNKDSLMIRNLYSAALSDNSGYKDLEFLCKKIGGRICGSPQAMASVEWSKQLLQQVGCDTVFLQPCKVHNWQRGPKEIAKVNSNVYGSYELSVCALGESVGTGDSGVYGNVIEVKSIDELKKMRRKDVEGKIVFFNRAMDPSNYYTFMSYGGAADQRVIGACEASKLGAVGVIVRSLSMSIDECPHTGIMRYKDAPKQIPAFAVSTFHAEKLSQNLKIDPALNLYMHALCKFLPEADSYNVIGELKGSEFPNEYIVVGGHLDAWDNGEGAHDDGVGCVQSIDVIKIFKKLNYKPRHSLRAVMFMDEEVSQRGGRKYAEVAKNNNEKHIVAIESDHGGFTPFGFSIDANDTVVQKIQKWEALLKPYGIYKLIKGGSGVDISFLKENGVPLMAILTDSQRYFDYQHAPSDTFEKVNIREMQLGTATLAAMIYLIDQYGLK